MISDSITNASATSAPTSKEFGKKKRNNRSAKLKQCKLDARREQWLSQVAAKNKSFKEEINVDRKSVTKKSHEMDCPIDNLDMERRDEDNGGMIHHESYTESPENSPTSSIRGGTDSSRNFSVGSSNSSSGNMTDDEEGGGNDDDGCLDDWEAVADALAANDKRENENPAPESLAEQQSVTELAPLRDSSNRFGSPSGSDLGVENANQDCKRMGSRKQGNGRAWRLDDEFRPQILPNLSKQHSFPATDRCFGSIAVPAACPICCEDLDLTDSRFLPCACGFRLCLFCHKRICDGDGRCPGCRKPYDKDTIKAEASVHGGSLTLRLARSCSMGYRS